MIVIQVNPENERVIKQRILTELYAYEGLHGSGRAVIERSYDDMVSNRMRKRNKRK